MEWLNKSDSSSRFYVTESSAEITGEEFSSLVVETLFFVLNEIIDDSSLHYDKLFLEINCDTGRIILSPSTEEGRTSGKLDGCAIRMQRLQDFWYDLDESGCTGKEFNEGVTKEILRIGEQFAIHLETFKESFISKSTSGSVELIVFGSEPEKILRRMYLLDS